MKLAVIGTGHWGINLVRTFTDLEVLDCLYDADAGRANEVAGRFATSAAASYEDILKNSAIEAVVVSTPAETHYELARRALLAGKDVFVEKPITLRCSDCLDLMELAERKHCILMAGHLLKFHPAVCRLKELVSSGALGQIEYIYSNRLNLGKVRREENALWSFAPHDISVILWLLNNEMPIQVSATGGTYLQANIADVTVSNLLFDHGVRAHIFVSWLHPYKEQKLVVIGSEAMACFDDVAKENKLQLFTKSIGLSNGRFITQTPVGAPVPYDASEPLRLECRHFLDCVATRSAPLTDGRDGLRVLTVLQTSQRSLQLNGEPVQVRSNSLEPVLMN
jgi:UDP-2-acetamido-3-amino-2,3-dideoxy-glucuronate N-acetyltransferase